MSGCTCIKACALLQAVRPQAHNASLDALCASDLVSKAMFLGKGKIWSASAPKAACFDCRESAPWQARASMFCPLVTVLGKCMATRYSAYSEGLWRAAAAVFNSVVNCGLPAVNMSYSNQDQPPTAAWQCLAEVFEWFLLGTRVIALDTVTTAEALEAAVATADDSPQAADSAAGPSAAAMLPATSESSAEALGQTAAGNAGTDRQTAAATAVDESSQAAAAASMRPSSETTGSESSPASMPVASTSRPSSKPSSRNPSRNSSRNPSRESSFNAATGDTEQSSNDADLEACVVDTLTDAVLTACTHAPEDVRKRLISVLDQATIRPKNRHIPNSAAGKNVLIALLYTLVECHFSQYMSLVGVVIKEYDDVLSMSFVGICA